MTTYVTKRLTHAAVLNHRAQLRQAIPYEDSQTYTTLDSSSAFLYVSAARRMLSRSPLTARHLADSETAVAELNAPTNLHSHQLDIRMLAVTASWSLAKWS